MNNGFRKRRARMMNQETNSYKASHHQGTMKMAMMKMNKQSLCMAIKDKSRMIKCLSEWYQREVKLEFKVAMHRAEER